MHKLIFSISSLIFALGFLISSIGDSFAYPQGPNISMGSNPIVSFDCNGNGYTVPSTSDYIMTDFLAVSSSPYMQFDGGSTMYFNFAGNSTLMTGYRVPSGTTITCGSGGIHVSGYLVHP